MNWNRILRYLSSVNWDRVFIVIVLIFSVAAIIFSELRHAGYISDVSYRKALLLIAVGHGSIVVSASNHAHRFRWLAYLALSIAMMYLGAATPIAGLQILFRQIVS
jgi:hypothetical protein